MFILVERETIFLLKAVSKVSFPQFRQTRFTGGELSRAPPPPPMWIPVLGDGLGGLRESFLVEHLLLLAP